MTTFTNEELNSLRGLIIHARGSSTLQKKFNVGYIEASKIIDKIDVLLNDTVPEKLDESEKDIYEITTDYKEMVITDTRTDKVYKIDMDLVHKGKVSAYLMEDREEAISNIESWIAESKNDSDKFLMREDLETLCESNAEYVFTYYGTNGFVAKDIDIKEFNKICAELIESFKDFKKKNKKKK